MNPLRKWSNWLLPRDKRSCPTRRGAGRRRMALEPLESRILLSVTSVTDSNVLFQTVDQNMWAAGPASKIEASFDKTLLDKDLAFSVGGFNKSGRTGLEAKFSGGIDLGVRGEFHVTGGEVDVDYQTDISVSAQYPNGSPIIGDIPAGSSFVIHTSDLPDAAVSRMETEFANIGAGLFLDYGFEAHGSVLGKFRGKEIVNFPFDKTIHNSLELIGADLDPGSGIGQLRLFGGGKQDVNQWGIDPGNPSLDFSDPTGILNASLFVPTLNTGVPGDGFDDSTFDTSTGNIVNAHLPVDRSQGQTRIDFFRLGLGIDNFIPTVTGLPLNFDLGGDWLNLSGSFINADLEVYLGIAQTMTFEPTLMVDLNFSVPTAVETFPGSNSFTTVSTKRVTLGEDIEIVHPGGTLDIDTDYVLAGSFRNDTDIYLSPAFTLELLSAELGGKLVDIADFLGIVNGDDLSFSLFSKTFALGDPTPIVGLFDQTFDLGGFSEVDGSDLQVTAIVPPQFTLLSEVNDPTINEGQDMLVNGTIVDTLGAGDGNEVYEPTIDWKDGTTETFTLDNDTSTPLPSHMNFDPVNNVFSTLHNYTDEVGSQDITFFARRITPGGSEDTDDAITTVVISNATPTVSLDPLFLDNDGNATLTGSYIDPGVLDSQTVSID